MLGQLDRKARKPGCLSDTALPTLPKVFRSVNLELYPTSSLAPTRKMPSDFHSEGADNRTNALRTDPPTDLPFNGKNGFRSDTRFLKINHSNETNLKNI